MRRGLGGLGLGPGSHRDEPYGEEPWVGARAFASWRTL